MRSSARTFRIMEYIVVVWVLLLSFYWISIASVMDNTLLFFGVAILTFLIGCSYLFFLQRGNSLLKKGVLGGFLLLTPAASVATLFLAPQCVCNVIQLMDLLPQCIALLMAIILIFTRPV